MTVGRLLYATDFSPASLAAWPAARGLAKVFRAELVVLHVVPPLEAPPGDFYAPDIFTRYWEEARDEAEAEIAKLVREAQGEGLKARSRVDKGRAADQIRLSAAEEQAALVVVGTAGRSGVQRLFIGSVADEVVRLAPCAVVTVGPAATHADGFGALLYPTDFSPASLGAWPMAEALAQAGGGKVLLLHVMPEVPEDPRISPAERAKLEAGYRRQAEQSVAGFLAKSSLPRARVQTILTHGVAEEQIVNHAVTTGAGVIVMGTHGWSGLLRWTLGSVAHRVVRTAPCPVLTVGPESLKEVRRGVA